MSKKLFVVSIAILFAVSLFDFSAFAAKSDDESFQIAKGGGFSSGGGGRSFSSGSRSFSSGSKSGGWGGSSKSSGSSSKSSGWGGSSKSSGSSSKSSGWGGSSKSDKSSSPSSNKSSGWGGSSKVSKEDSAKAAVKSFSGTRDSNKMTRSEKAADVAAYKAAVTQGTAFKTKAEAVESFKKDADVKYPSKFEKEPTTKPDYIPNDYNVGGKTVPITYNQQGGGYGYTDPLTNAFVLYSLANMASDSHRDVVMAKNGYYVGEPVKTSHGFLAVLLVVVIISILCVGFVIVPRYYK